MTGGTAVDGFSTTLSEGRVYVNGEGVYALDADTGGVQWKYKPPGSLVASLTVVDGAVYTTEGPRVIALDGKTGELKWEVITGKGRSPVTPTFADGILYVGSGLGRNGIVYALNVTALEKGKKTTYNIKSRSEDLGGLSFLPILLAVVVGTVLYLRRKE